LLITVFAVLFLSNAYAEDEKKVSPEKTFLLPASLIQIEDDAFEGTAAATVILPKDLQEVKSSAFSGMGRLNRVYYPDSLEHGLPVCLTGKVFVSAYHPLDEKVPLKTENLGETSPAIARANSEGQKSEKRRQQQESHDSVTPEEKDTKLLLSSRNSIVKSSYTRRGEREELNHLVGLFP